MSLLNALADPLAPHHMQRALLAIAVIAVPAGILGAWVVVRRQAFLTHAVGHATFPALVIGALAGWNLLATSIVAAVLIALVIAALSRRAELRSGAAVAIVLSSSLAIGAVLVSDIHDPGITANGLLFGSVFAVTDADLVVMSAAAGLTLVAGLIGFRPFAAAAFDTANGQIALRSRPDAVQLVLLAVAIAISARVIGSLLVAALFLIPSATARQFTRRLPTLMAWGIVLAAAEGVLGLWIAARFNAPPGAAIAATAATLFVVVATARHLRLTKMRTLPT